MLALIIEYFKILNFNNNLNFYKTKVVKVEILILKDFYCKILDKFTEKNLK